jgi:hypothetical protein
MRILARGWKRDHGAKQIAAADLSKAVLGDEVDWYDEDETYVRVLRARRRLREREGESDFDPESEEPRVRISMSAHVVLNGQYQIQCLLTKSDIARLFRMTHGQDFLDDVVVNLAAISTEQQQEE